MPGNSRGEGLPWRMTANYALEGGFVEQFTAAAAMSEILEERKDHTLYSQKFAYLLPLRAAETS